MNATQGMWTGVILGFIIGGCIPMFWGTSPFTFTGFIVAIIGALIGVYIATMFTNYG